MSWAHGVLRHSLSHWCKTAQAIKCFQCP
uniref:Uncharacterized protein n=1 Tax=Arundo donax TaxID=35708 RepID=A0A0A9BTA3_ARUDO